MTGNTFGKLFKITTCGESHGPMYLCIVDGCPAGLELSEADIQPELDRRKPGTSKYTSQRRESDQVKIVSGVFEGKTTGAPIGLVVENQAQKSKDYNAYKDVFRPGHADYTYQQKYGIRDHRGGGRASARETMMRVAAGAIAKKYLSQHFGINIQGYLSQLGDIPLQCNDIQFARNNPFYCADPDAIPALEARIDQLRQQGDSCGAKVTVIATDVPAGIGEPVYEGLDACLAQAMMSINAVKGVEIGDGFDCVKARGSEFRDAMTPESFSSNHSGGVLGGISTGQDIVTSVAFKPTSSIVTPIPTIDVESNQTIVQVKGRHDPCVGLRAVPIVEAMMALVLVDLILTNYPRK